tara:strand:- start:551 stop:1555 length:1005 start_codon:yes stop_codon:yes gene_type:complete
MTRPDEISFVVITNGANKKKLSSLIWSIVYNGRNHLKDYEILLCGHLEDPSDRLIVGDWENKVNFIPLKEQADNARLGEMRNAGCTSSKFDTICILDDDFVLTKDWARNIPHSYFDIMTTQVRVPDGGRFWDHACYQSKTRGHVILMPEENDDNIYMSGGTAWMLKKKVFEKVQWGQTGIYEGVQTLEEYREGKHNEDTLFSKACRDNKFLIVHNHDSISYHDDDTYTSVGRFSNRRRGDKNQSWVKSIPKDFSPSVFADFSVVLFKNGFIAEANDILRYGLMLFPNNYDLSKKEKDMEDYAGKLDDNRFSVDKDPLLKLTEDFYIKEFAYLQF